MLHLSISQSGAMNYGCISLTDSLFGDTENLLNKMCTSNKKENKETPLFANLD